MLGSRQALIESYRRAGLLTAEMWLPVPKAFLRDPDVGEIILKVLEKMGNRLPHPWDGGSGMTRTDEVGGSEVASGTQATFTIKGDNIILKPTEYWAFSATTRGDATFDPDFPGTDQAILSCNSKEDLEWLEGVTGITASNPREVYLTTPELNDLHALGNRDQEKFFDLFTLSWATWEIPDLPVSIPASVIPAREIKILFQDYLPEVARMLGSPQPLLDVGFTLPELSAADVEGIPWAIRVSVGGRMLGELEFPSKDSADKALSSVRAEVVPVMKM